MTVAVGLLGLAGLVSPWLYLSGLRLFCDVRIPGPGYTLHGHLSPGDDPVAPWVVFLHGHRKAGQAHPLYTLLRRNLSRRVSVLAVDLRGFGRSELGTLSPSDSILDRSADVEAALDYLEGHHGVSPDQVILMGHSFGAAQVLASLRGFAAAEPSRVVRDAILIGPADYDVFVQGDARMADYMAKVERNMGVTMTPEQMRHEGGRLTPGALFAACPEVSLTIVVGAQDHGDTLRDRREKIPEACRRNIRWIVVPLSNHMYWTEGRAWFKSLRGRLSVSLLVWRLNGLLEAHP